MANIALMQGLVKKLIQIGIIDTMFRKPSKKQLFIRRGIIYAIMTLAVIVIVSITVLLTLGYRINSESGVLEQGALIQFDSRPNGGQIHIDGQRTSAQTAAKRSVLAGAHSFMVTRDGYNSWSKDLTLEAGTLTWLDYIRLVPENLQAQQVLNYETVYGEKASPDNRFILLQQKAEVPTFQLLDLRNREVRSTDISLPQEVISEATAEGVSHRFTMDTWDDSGRYMIVTHEFNDQREWIVVDTQDVATSVNVTRLFSIGLSDLQFAGTSGSIFFGLSDGIIRKLDLSGSTISRGLVSRVESFSMYDTNILTYVGIDAEDQQQRVAGLYRDGDDAPHIIRSAPLDVTLAIDTARYSGTDYIAVSEGANVSILEGRYPTSSQSEVGTTMRVQRELTAVAAPSQLTFSGSGKYLLVQTGKTFSSYEIEYDRLTAATVEANETNSRALRWLDDAHLWVVYDGQVSMRDFDGTNAHNLMTVEPGFDVTLSPNGRYIYGVARVENGYALQRVQMILE